MRTLLLTVTLPIITLLNGATGLGDERTIQVSGLGQVNSRPDIATISTGVTTEAKEAREALSDNNESMAAILKLLKQLGIAEKDVQTSGFNIHPVYSRDRQQQAAPQITGYRVQNDVRVRVRQIDELGKVLDALVSAGSNRISRISFGVDDTHDLLQQARRLAVADAKERATVYADASGTRVGKVLSISEHTTGPPVMRQPRSFHLPSSMAAAASVPVATGELDFSATVHMVFALEDAADD